MKGPIWLTYKRKATHMKTLDVEVVDMRKMKVDGKLKAIADVRFGGAVTIKGFFVMDGDSGISVLPPRKPGKDGRWFETLVFDSDSLRRDVMDKVLETYDQEIKQAA